MKKTKKIISGILAFSIFVSLTGCKMIEKTPERIAKQTAFKVNGQKVARAEIDDRITYMDKTLKSKFGENFAKNQEAQELLLNERKKMADILVKNAVIKNKAKELNIKLDEKEVKEAIDKDKKSVKDRFKTEEEYKKTLKDENLTEEKLEARIKENVEAQMYLDKLYEHETKNIKTEEKELKDYYAQHMEDFTEKPNGMKLAQIVVKTQEEANEIKKQLDSGADFKKLVKEKSIDAKTKAKDGEIGFVEYKNMYKSQYLLPAMSKNVGEITDPTTSEQGYHIIKVLEKTNYVAESYDKVKDRINDIVLKNKKMKKFEEVMSKWTEDAKIKIYEENLK